MKQLPLFESPSLNTISRFKTAMRAGIKSSGLSRDQVADRMSDAIALDGLKTPGNAESVSVAILDKWLADGAAHLIPLSLLPVFCHVVGSELPFTALMAPLGLTVITEDRLAVLKWGEAEIEKRRHSKRAKKLAEEIGL